MAFKDSKRLTLLPALIAVLVYLPVLRNGLVWDDITFLSDLPLYRDPALWTEALRQPFLISPNYFRPLVLLTFIGEIYIAGLNPTLFHLTNLLLHALNTLLVTLLARCLWSADNALAGQGKSPLSPLLQRGGLESSSSAKSESGRVDSGLTLEKTWLPLVASLLYALHPVLLEGVAFISSRFDLVLTTLLLLTLLADRRLKDRRFARPALVGFLFLLAALTKEMAVAFVPVLPLYHLTCDPRPLRPLSRFWTHLKISGDLATYAALLIAGILYLALRYLSLGYLLLPLSGIPTGGPVQHLLLIVRSLAEYALLVAWPFTSLTPIHYHPLPVPIHDLRAWLSLAGTVLLVFALTGWVRRAPRSGWLAVAALLSLMPVVNILPLDLTGGAFIAERFLLFPLALLSLAVAPLLLSLFRRHTLARALPLLWLAAGLVTIQTTLPHWHSDRTLWEWTARRVPHSDTPHTNLARIYSDGGNHGAGLAAAQKAQRLNPSSAWPGTTPAWPSSA